SEDLSVAADLCFGLGELVEDFVALERGQALEPQIEDLLRLNLRERELRHQPLLSGTRIGRPTDQRDHPIEVIESNREASEDVKSLLGFPELEGSAPPHDVATVLEKHLESTLKIQDPRPTLDDRQHVNPEGVLHRRVPVELVQNNVGDRIALQLD